MRVTFVVMGWENISVEYISSYVKTRGHEVRLAYEQALFDDKNYLCIPFAAKILDQGSNIIKQIIDTSPDIVAFSVMAVSFQWAIKLSEEIKKYLDVPVVFGGAHAIMCPERIINKKSVDVVCTGEGEFALADLLDSMENGGIDTSIKGFWFKTKPGEIIKNEKRPLIADLDSMPLPDKDLFAPYVPIKNYYLASTSRGCPFNCTYCSVSYITKLEKELENFKKVRERSVDSVIEELKINKAKYNFKWIDFRNSVFSPSKNWILEYCERHKKEINLPFRIFGHPLLINEEMAIALKEAGCFAIQIGLESYDPHVRNDILKRYESNEQINNAIDILEKNKVPYSLDYILGLPDQNEEELKKAAELFSGLKYCYRISPFMLSYLPKLEIIDYAIEHGMLDKNEREKIEEGLHGNYMYEGSDMDKDKRRLMNTYKLLFRSMSFMPSWLRKIFYKSKLYFIFYAIPFDLILRSFDLTMVIRDHDARAYALNYWWWFKKRFNPKHPNYFLNKMKKEK
ncbi:MAG: B12-binding domain-containing radical SAM protein [Candidatus Latescibacteria bacterium]|jgi:anaerobic magnesium-protoporphyrin IX monomethyl ester cyclase|nr:B12-binding domain-containing radical SAM protein [Candidatus Latescibacterota bacterium]